MASIYVSPTGNDSTGNGSQALPYLTLVHAVTVMAGGDWIFSASGVADTITATITPPAGTAANPTRIVGVDASWNPLSDPSQVASFPSVTMNNTTANILTLSNNFISIENYTLDGGSGASKAAACINASGTGVHIQNCKVTRYSDRGIVHSGSGAVRQVWATGGVSGCRQGISLSGFAAAEFCAVTGSAGPGFLIGSSSDIIRCVAASLTGASAVGLEVTGAAFTDHFTAFGCASDGIKISYVNGVMSLRNSISYGSTGGYGINSSAVNLTWADEDYCALGSNSSGDRHQIPVGAHDVSLSGDPFVSSGGSIASLADVFANFALNSTSGAGAACRATGYPAYVDIGALQHQDSGGGGGGAVLSRVFTGY